jgi:2-oxoisovalerate dehydrogenase E2 component (dihydrolipoyl transacylase)
MASPATRRRAREAGIDLAKVAGSGPGGRILATDVAPATASSRTASAPAPANAPPGRAASVAAAADVEEIKVIGVRRLIAQRMSEAKRTIPHFAYVEEVDVTDLETLRTHMNSRLQPGQAPLTYLPFIIAALVPVLRDFPQCNAHYDEARNVILRYRPVHVGIATQTPDGLKVPVLRDAGRFSLRELAQEVRRVSEAARDNQARREDLTGSTITVTSLGRLGGIVSTPILNAPEVAIVGVNKAVERAVVRDGNIVIRRMMNLSSSFDHRFVDGFDAAAMIQALKERLEHPATIFTD